MKLRLTKNDGHAKKMMLTRLFFVLLAAAVYGCAANSGATNTAPEKGSREQTSSNGNSSTMPSANSLIVASQTYDLCPVDTQGKAFATVKTEGNWKKLLTTAKSNLGDPTVWRPDFLKQAVVVYQVGRRASLGYKPELVRAVPTSTTMTLDLFIKRNRPQSGSMQASVVSQPCLLALIAVEPKAHPPQIIRVIDVDSGAVLGQTAHVDPEFIF